MCCSILSMPKGTQRPLGAQVGPGAASPLQAFRGTAAGLTAWPAGVYLHGLRAVGSPPARSSPSINKYLLKRPWLCFSCVGPRGARCLPPLPYYFAPPIKRIIRLFEREEKLELENGCLPRNWDRFSPGRRQSQRAWPCQLSDGQGTSCWERSCPSPSLCTRPKRVAVKEPGDSTECPPGRISITRWRT